MPSPTEQAATTDTDGDNEPDASDNCRAIANPDQTTRISMVSGTPAMP